MRNQLARNFKENNSYRENAYIPLDSLFNCFFKQKSIPVLMPINYLRVYLNQIIREVLESCTSLAILFANSDKINMALLSIY